MQLSLCVRPQGTELLTDTRVMSRSLLNLSRVNEHTWKRKRERERRGNPPVNNNISLSAHNLRAHAQRERERESERELALIRSLARLSEASAVRAMQVKTQSRATKDAAKTILQQQASPAAAAHTVPGKRLYIPLGIRLPFLIPAQSWLDCCIQFPLYWLYYKCIGNWGLVICLFLFFFFNKQHSRLETQQSGISHLTQLKYTVYFVKL